MIANKARVYTTDREPQSRFAFWALCFFAFMALCLSLVLLTGCGQTDGGANADSSQTSSTQSDNANQELDGSGTDDSGADNPGFVIEDTAVVDVKIDGE
jgi:hypothetical protein